MKLLAEEKIQFESDDKSIILTNLRVRQTSKKTGTLRIKSIILSKITSIEYVFKSKPILIGIFLVFLFGAVFFGAASNGSNQEMLGGSVISGLISLICILFYFLTRKKGLEIASPSIKMFIELSKAKEENILEFMNKVEENIK